MALTSPRALRGPTPHHPATGEVLLGAAGGGALIVAGVLLTAALIEDGATTFALATAESPSAYLAVASGVVAVAVVLGAAIGTPIGLTLSSPARRRRAALLWPFVLWPLAVPPLVVALGVARVIEAVGGIDGALQAGGFTLPVARNAIVLAIAHVPLAAGVVALVVGLAGRRTNDSILEAARLLGASQIRRFFALEWPVVAPSMALGVVLACVLVATSLGAAS